MNVHNHLHRRHASPNPEPAADPQQTVVSIVYVTAPATFAGATAGFSTLGPAITPSEPAAAASTSIQVDPSIIFDSTSQSSQVQTTLKTSVTSQALLSSSTSNAVLLSSTTTTPSTESETSSTASAASATSTSSSSGMSSSGKAGLAIGLLILIGAVLGLILCCFRKRRNSVKTRGEKMEDEKHDSHEFQPIERPPLRQAEMSRSKSITTPNAPRLSLKRASQFLPDLTVKPKRLSPVVPLSPVLSEPDSRPTTSHSNSKENPFGNHAETIDFTNANGPPVLEPLSPSGEIVEQSTQLSRGASKSGPKPMDFTKNSTFMGPPSPVGTEFSTSSDPNAASTPMGNAIAAAGGPANSAVHRVQLDFNPSMGDELELRAGQLVRLLHEYDDGWAMCIRLDRSQQGVAPRTCLSTRPVKPRPQQNGARTSPPSSIRNSQVPRPLTPQLQAPRPLSPATRPMTPNGQQRPLTPQGSPSRPMTPQSDAEGLRPSSAKKPVQFNGPSSSPPTGPLPVGPVSRKPVPGQAL